MKKPIKILMADDNELYKTSLENMLKSSAPNYKMEFASNADEEIAKAKSKKYSLIITDNQMKDGYGDSGIYAITQIRLFDQSTPILFNSTDRTSDLKRRALAAGANYVIPNFDIDVLIKSIEKYARNEALLMRKLK